MNAYTEDKMDTYHTYCKKCDQKFIIIIQYTEKVKIEFCLSCGEKINNPVYYKDYGKNMTIKVDDGCMRINIDK